MASQIFLEPPELTLHERFLQKDEADRFFSILRTTIAWRQESMRIAGRAVTLPRLTAWYGDPGASYTYSGICNDPVPWTAALWELKERVAAAAGQAFNSVLLNLYRSGGDSMGWHSDDEREISSTIASLSLGAARTFQLRRKAPPGGILSLRLTGGSLLVMFGQTQRHWQHRVPKEPAEGERINLTFRRVLGAAKLS